LKVKVTFYNLLKSIIIYLAISSCGFAQKMDFENSKFQYDLDSLDVWKFKLDYSEKLYLFNHGITIDKSEDNYKIVGASHWSNHYVINDSLGFFSREIFNTPVVLTPFIFSRVLSKELKQNLWFDYKYNSNQNLAVSLTNEIANYLNSNLRFEEIKKNHELEIIEENFLKNKLYFNGRRVLNRLISKNHASIFQDKSVESSITISPIFLQVYDAEVDKEILYIEMRFFQNKNFLFKTSISVYKDWYFLKDQNFTLSSFEKNQIIESLFHQIILE